MGGCSCAGFKAWDRRPSLIPQLDGAAGEIGRAETLQDPRPFLEDGGAIRLTQCDDDHALMVGVEVGDRMKKVPVGGQEDRPSLLGFGDNVGIRRSLAVRAPEIEHDVAQTLEHACGRLGEVLVEEELHATAS